MTSQRFYATTSVGQIHGRRMGSAAEPVVLLHRTPVDSSGFEAVLDFLAAAELDRVGCFT